MVVLFFVLRLRSLKTGPEIKVYRGLKCITPVKLVQLSSVTLQNIKPRSSIT